jgi:hypothetical protein
MARSKQKSIPPSSSLDDLVKFFDTHDTGEYWEQLPEAHFDVNIVRRKHLIAIDAEISGKLTEIAQSRKVSSQKLVNSWLREKIRKAG